MSNRNRNAKQDSNDSTTDPTADAPATESPVVVADAPESTDADTTDPTADAPESTDADTTADAPTESAGPTADERADAFRTAYAAALADADPTTGTVPTDATAAVVAAFRELRGNARSSLPLTLSSEATAAAMADPTAPNVGALLAVGTLSTALATAPARAASEPRERDVVGDAARAVFVARWQESAALASLDPSQRADALAAVGTESPDTWHALASFMGWNVPRSGRKASAATRTASDGPRMPIAPHVAHALASVAPGVVMTVAQIVAHDSSELGAVGRVAGTVSPGAVTNAITRGDFGNVHAVAVRNAAGTLSAQRVS